jgi:hypothetical protein
MASRCQLFEAKLSFFITFTPCVHFVLRGVDGSMVGQLKKKEKNEEVVAIER